MRVAFFVSCFLLIISNLFSQEILQTPFEISKGKQTTTYEECISYYRTLDSMYDEIKMFDCGLTDIGKPLNIVVVSSDKDFDPNKIHRKNKEIIMINNGIHPGEPDGIDASMMFIRDLMLKPELHKLLDNIVLVVIPVYNIDGSLNRNSTSRVNQNGPESFGFRGNAENLDLNRDFIKCDSKNAHSFEEIFQKWKPGLLIDNHVSDGADYQYTLTYFATQHSSLESDIRKVLDDVILPKLNKNLDDKGNIHCPYVNEYKTTPDSGIVGFYDSPRYCTGYASLFNCIGFTVETHMLKPFNDRVIATYQFMKSFLEVMNTSFYDVKLARESAYYKGADSIIIPLTWKLDTTRFDKIDFKGYEGKYKKSEVSGLERLYYDENAPYDKQIKYYNYYKPIKETTAPYYYIIPQAWTKIVDLLKLNGIKVKRLSDDAIVPVTSYYVKDFETVKKPYEGHYLHYNTNINSLNQKVQYHKGDYVVAIMKPPVNPGNQSIPQLYPMKIYAIETLEPEGADSYFNWNFFDAVLMQKEGYSDYVFEDIAADLLQHDKSLRDSLNAAIAKDSKLANDAHGQLDWVYHHSKYYEKTHNLYPVGKVMEYISLPLED